MSGTPYDAPDLHLGQQIAVQGRDGKLHTTTVTGVRYESGSPAIYRELNTWQRWLRRFTPKRWRKSLLIQAAVPPSVTISTGEDEDARKRYERTIANLAQAGTILDGLIKCEPDGPTCGEEQ